MRSGPPTLVIILLFASFAAVELPHASGAYPDQTVLDGKGDVTAFTIRERKVQGHQEIDIISLETFDRGVRVEAYLTLREDIRDTFGFIYSMSIGGITVIYDNGTKMVYRDSDQEPFEDIDVEIINKNQLYAEIPKISMEGGDFIINGTAQEYLLDYNDEVGRENFFDSISGNGIVSTISQFQVSLDDDQGDVRFSFIEETSSSDQRTDILSITLRGNGDRFELEMEMASSTWVDDGEPYDLEGLQYFIHLGKEEYIVTGQGATSLQSSGRTIIEHTLTKGRVTLELSGGAPVPGEIIYGSTWLDIPDGGWLEDICPDIPSRQLDVFPVGSGSKIEMEMSITLDGEGEFSISTSGFDPDAEDRLLSMIDMDLSGTVGPGEFDPLMDPIIQGLDDVEVVIADGKVASGGASYDHTGLDGTMEEFEISLNIPLEMDLPENGVLSVEIMEFRPSSPASGIEGTSTVFILNIPDGYQVIPQTVRPEGLGNHIREGRIELVSDDPRDLDLVTTGLSFDIKKKEGGVVDGEDPIAYEKVPTWAYVVGVIVLLGAGVLVYRLVRGRKPLPPEEGF